MSIKGQSFAASPIGGHIATAVGNAAGLYNGAFTVMLLMKFSTTDHGFFGGWAGGIGGASRGGMLLSTAALFGENDFSSGYGTGFNDSVWRWYGYSKDAGAAHYVMHYADIATLTWSDGESVGAGNHADTGTSDAFSLGMNVNYAMGFDTGDLAAGAIWNSHLSPSAIHAACTLAASDLAIANPLAGWLLPQASAGNPISDFTGGGADETSRAFIATSADPPGFSFAIASAPSYRSLRTYRKQRMLRQRG